MSEKLKCKLKIRSVSRMEPPNFNSECPDCDDLMKHIAQLEAVAEAAEKVARWAPNNRELILALRAAGYPKGEGE